MGSTYEFRKKALEKLKLYEGMILTAREILEITGFSKNTNISDCWIGRHGEVTLVEKFGDYSKENKYRINEIDVEKYMNFINYRRLAYDRTEMENRPNII